MALDNADFISQLSIVDPPGTDAVAEGDDHIRTVKRATQQSFPNVDAAVPQTAAQMGQMAIKNEANIFTLNNTFNGVNTFFQNAVVQSVTGTERALQFHNNAIRQWAWRQEAAANDLFLDRYVAGNFVDSPISVSNSNGAVTVDATTDFKKKMTITFGQMQIRQGSIEVTDLQYAQSSGNSRWIWRMDSDLNGNGMLLNRRDAAGASIDNTIQVDVDTGNVTFLNAVSMDRPDTTRNLNWRRNGFSVWQIQHQNDANDNAWRLRRNDFTGTLLSVPIRVTQSNGLIFLTLQSSDPGVSGALWQSGQSVVVSP